MKLYIVEINVMDGVRFIHLVIFIFVQCFNIGQYPLTDAGGM
jgi:hypothetical protein